MVTFYLFIYLYLFNVLKVGQRIPESKQNVFFGPSRMTPFTLLVYDWISRKWPPRNSCAAPQFSPYHLLIACHVGQNHEATTRPQTAWPLHRNQGIRKLSTFRHVSLLTVPRVVDAKFTFVVVPKLTVVTSFLLRNYRLFLFPLSPHPKIFSPLSSTFFYVSREWVGPHLLHI